MRYSQLFGKSVRAVSAEIKSKGHEYLVRAGYIRESSAGRFYLLPLGMKLQEKVCRVIEDEMNLVGAQRMLAPNLHPRELWEETQRTENVSFELMQVTDRNQRSFVLGGTAEEMLVALVRQFSLSERDLPLCLYQFSSKFRDELRARGGMLRAREFLMKDAYSFHTGRDQFEEFYERMSASYRAIFSRLDLPAHVVASDNGYMGGDYCHEFVVDHELGESRYLVSDDGSYCAHEDIATFSRTVMNENEQLKAMQVTHAPRGTSIQAGVEFYGLPEWRQIKSLIYFTEQGEPLLASLRGDLEINETKLTKAASCRQLRLATEDEVRRLGSVVGFVSPLNLRIKRFGDLSLTTVRNFYTGADEWQRDTLNVNYGRDFSVDVLTDIALARDGDRCVTSNSPLHEHRGIEVGNIFQLGTWYSERMTGAEFTSSAGTRAPFYMGCYGIGVGRTMATIAELYHDDRGLIWPKASAPYEHHLVLIGKDSATTSQAEELYEALRSAGREVLFDDRDVSAGIKLTDADLLGIPTRIVVSNRLVSQGSVELRCRKVTAVTEIRTCDFLGSLRPPASSGTILA